MAKQKDPPRASLDDAQNAANQPAWSERFTSEMTPVQEKRRMPVGMAAPGMYWVMLWTILTLLTATAVEHGIQSGFDTLTIAELAVLGVIWILLVRAVLSRRKPR